MNIFISNLDSRTTEKDLHDLLSEYGRFHSSRIRSIMDLRTRAFNTFTYIEIADDEVARQAMNKYTNTVLLGRAIKMEPAG